MASKWAIEESVIQMEMHHLYTKKGLVFGPTLLKNAALKQFKNDKCAKVSVQSDLLTFFLPLPLYLH